MRRLLGMIALILSLCCVAGSAHAYWTGFWTWTTTPPPPRWVWTWVWVWDSSFTVSSLAAAASATGDDQAPGSIVVHGFSTIGAGEVTYDGLLATNFTAALTPSSTDPEVSDLVLNFDGLVPVIPDGVIGTMTLSQFSVSPDSVPPVELSYEQAFLFGSETLSSRGTFSSAVPEPATLGLFAVPVIALAARYRRRR